MTVALCLPVTSQEPEISEFVPPWEIPADALSPENKHLRLIDDPDDIPWFAAQAASDPEQTEWSQPTSENKDQDAVRTLMTGLDQLLGPGIFQGPDRSQASPSEVNSPGIAATGDMKLPAQFAAAVRQRIGEKAWESWQNDEEEYYAKVAFEADDLRLTNGDVLFEFGPFFAAVRKSFSRQGATPDDYLVYRQQLTQREIEKIRFHHTQACQSARVLSPDELRVVKADAEQDFESEVIPQLVRAFRLQSQDDLPQAMKDRSTSLEALRSIHETVKLSRYFTFLHKCLYQDADGHATLEPANSSVQWAEGAIQFEDGTAIRGVVVSSTLESLSGLQHHECRPEGDSGSYLVKISNQEPRFVVDFREAEDWPHESAISESDTSVISEPVIDALVVTRYTEKAFVNRDIIIPRARPAKLDLVWQGNLSRVIVTVMVIPFEKKTDVDVAEALAARRSPLDGELRYIRSFPAELHRDQRISIPNLMPGRVIVAVRSMLGRRPSIQTIVLTEKDNAEMRFNPDQSGIARVRCGESQVLRLGANSSESSDELFVDAALRQSSAASRQNVKVDAAKFEFELRMTAPGWDRGFLIWRSAGERRGDFRWDPVSDPLSPGSYSLLVRSGNREQCLPFEILPDETTELSFELSDLRPRIATDSEGRPRVR